MRHWWLLNVYAVTLYGCQQDGSYAKIFITYYCCCFCGKINFFSLIPTEWQRWTVQPSKKLLRSNILLRVCGSPCCVQISKFCWRRPYCNLAVMLTSLLKDLTATYFVPRSFTKSRSVTASSSPISSHSCTCSATYGTVTLIQMKYIQPQGVTGHPPLDKSPGQKPQTINPPVNLPYFSLLQSDLCSNLQSLALVYFCVLCIFMLHVRYCMYRLNLLLTCSYILCVSYIKTLLTYLLTYLLLRPPLQSVEHELAGYIPKGM